MVERFKEKSMKKKYSTPQTEVTEVRPAGMMALSGIIVEGSITNPDDFGVREESDLFDNNYAFDF